jgi:hypothetical protein
MVKRMGSLKRIIKGKSKILDSNFYLLRRRVIRNKLKTDNKRKRGGEEKIFRLNSIPSLHPWSVIEF